MPADRTSLPYTVDSEEEPSESEDDCTIEELRAKLDKSRWETVDALRQALKAVQERNQYHDMVKELQDLLREAIGKLEYWKGLVGECEKMDDEPVDAAVGMSLPYWSCAFVKKVLTYVFGRRISLSLHLFSFVSFPIETRIQTVFLLLLRSRFRPTGPVQCDPFRKMTAQDTPCLLPSRTPK